MLINCVAYEQGKRVAEMRVEEIGEYLQRPGCFVWVALKNPTPDELAQLQAQFDLHQLAIEDTLGAAQRPKVEEYGDAVFAVLKVPQINGKSFDLGELDLFVGPNYVLSVRHDFEPGLQAVRDRVEREPDLLSRGSGFVFYALMDNVVDRYFPIVDALEVELEKIEERIFTEASPRTNIRELYLLKHKLMVMRHVVEPLIEVVHKLYGGRVPQVCSSVQEYFRDVYDHLLRVSQQMDGLRDMVITAMSVNLSMITMTTGEVTKRLAAYAALVAVPTLIAGVYGMNFQHMPELHWQYGYPFAVAVMLVIDGVLWRKFRRAGWL
ncbi:MAG TPA: magnesium/cobalt transporter CorA [Usitatibacter sp.]|nr:magnesium/cobalt transporter CorA [Usitatibacter sp.]